MSAKIVFMQSVYFDMVGCRLNQAEIESMARDFAARGFRVVDQPIMADLIVVNTCCVTLKAAADSRKMLRHYQSQTKARVVGTGCWNTAFPAQADMILGAANQIPNRAKDMLAATFSDSPLAEDQIAGIQLGRRQRTRAFVKVQDGCNNRCSYCLTQIARGPSQSESVEGIVNIINQLVENGIKEVVLTGVQIGSWGKDLGNYRLHDLLDTILERTNIPRLRLSSIEPWDVTEDLLERFDNPRFCPHLHIPIQSGSEKVLRDMRRPLAKSDLSALIEMVRTSRPGVAITTDIIVGFPGETQADLDETLEFIESNQFVGGHVFKFSPMPGTEAHAMPNQVQESVRKVRLKQVQSLFDDLMNRALARKIGLSQEVLFEASRGGVYEGYTPDYFRVKTNASCIMTNTIHKILIKSVFPDGKLEGIIA